MGELNFYDFISFPNREERDKIRRDFFDFGVLHLSEKEIVPNERKVPTLNEFSKRDIIHYKIVFFNNNMSYLDLAGLQFAHYYNLFLLESDNDKRTIREILFKQAYRNMCVEVKVLEEKIKDFLRFIYNMSLKDTKSDCKFLKILGNELSKTEYGKIFWRAIKRYWRDGNIQKITADRNDETHNETCLLTSLDSESDTNNKKYFETIKGSLIAALELKKAFQDFLEKSYPDLRIISQI